MNTDPKKHLKIGIFTDSYHPSINGIAVVAETTKRNLELLGNSVIVVAPDPSFSPWQKRKDKGTIRVKSISGIFFPEQSTSFFLPPTMLRKIKKQQFDVIMIYTPGQIGLLGTYAARKLGIPLVSFHGTDLIEYIRKYPSAMIGVLGLFLSAPFVLKTPPKELATITKGMATKDNHLTWSQNSIKHMIAALNRVCTSIIAPSQKTAKQLKKLADTPIYTIPTGINPGVQDPKKVARLRQKYDIKTTDKVLLYLGRVAEEKNIDLLIDSMPEVIKNEPAAKLVIVGDFDYRKTLEQKVTRLKLDKHAVFTGKLSLAERWNGFALGDVFCFPSLTDTQALVINEAASMGLPLIWCDNDINDILQHKSTGLHSANNPRSMAKAMTTLLKDPKIREKYGTQAKKLAAKYSEEAQAEKLEQALRSTIDIFDQKK